MKKSEQGTPAEEAWNAFEKTGKISYYMLYNKLKNR